MWSSANTFFVHPDYPGTMYLGTDLGVLFSENFGATWVSVNANGMANVAVDWLTYQPSTKRAFAFTHGRGVFMSQPLIVGQFQFVNSLK